MKKSTSLFLVAVALIIMWAYGIYIIISWQQCKTELKEYRKVEFGRELDVIDYSKYSCPPNLSDYQCMTFVRFALVNGFDVDEFLLSRYRP